MLSISRSAGKSVRLKLPDGTYIWVTYQCRNDSGRAVLGFTAPRSVVIEREEIIKEGPRFPHETVAVQPPHDGVRSGDKAVPT